MPSVNNVFRLTGTFQQAGVNADPAGAITLVYTDPTGKATSVGPYTVAQLPIGGMVKDSLGVFHVDIVPTVAGRWTYTWSSAAGAGQSSQTTTAVVEGAPATYASVADIRAYGITVAAADDATVADKLEVASRSIDNFCGLNTASPLSLPSFGNPTVKTVQVSDIRNPIIQLPSPFSAVTRVSVNGLDFPASGTSTVAAAPTPTTTAFAVAPGDGIKFAFDRALTVGGVDANAWQVVGDTLTLSTALTTAPTAGATVVQYPWVVEPFGIRLYTPGFLNPDVNLFPRLVSYGWRVGYPYGAAVLVTATFGYATVPQPVRQACILIAAQLLQAMGQEIIDPRIVRLSVEGYTVMYDRKSEQAGEFSITTGVSQADDMLRRYRADTWMVA